MRRVTKKLIVFVIGLFLIVVYCDFLIYYVVIAQCSWPQLNSRNSDNFLKALIIADIHLMGPRKGHWFDKWRRESQMHRAFQTVLTMHSPETVFILGDIFDEGEWSKDGQFKEYVDRFITIFAVPKKVIMLIAVGNHDIGLHNYLSPVAAKRFNKAMNSTSVQFVTIKQSHFVIINSMAMQGDTCDMCMQARRRIDYIAENLNCSHYPSQCPNVGYKLLNYSRPILMQHFPLYRNSDAACTEPDAAPLPLRNKRFRNKLDAISKEATEYLVGKLKPRAVFGGHTHHGCLLHHTYEHLDGADFYEYSVPSFSWRNRADPKFMLVSITPDEYAVNKCRLPEELSIAVTAVILLSIVTWYTVTSRVLGKL